MRRLLASCGQSTFARSNQDEGHGGVAIAAIAPSMPGSALNDDISGLEHGLCAIVELKADFAIQHDIVVDAIGSMHA